MRREDNEMITRVGPDTPMGRVMRRYWTPIALASQVEKRDSDPVRARFCGEDYVLFRDTNGRLGLMDELCPHRGASLALGRVEDCGIRCLYHGWKYDVDGRLLDTPNYHNENFRAKFRAPAYPAREAGGLIWGYFGPRDEVPTLPDYAFLDAPPSHRNIERIDINCNYLQLLEGGMDSSHVGILHADVAKPGWWSNSGERNPDALNPGALASDDDAPVLSIESTDFGFHYAAVRKLPNGGTSVRIVPFILPNARVIPAQARVATLFEVPLDDENTSTYIIVHANRPYDRAHHRSISGIGERNLYSETDFKWRATWANRFGQDRTTMDRSWGGFHGLEQEDAAVALSMGPIFDRTREHLVPADAAVIHMRRILLTAARDMEAGKEPPALPSMARITGIADTDLAPGTKWQSLVPHHAARRDNAPLAETAD
jgi:phenylpropionate dioxygenase-like ring-hydroxylating dioxygenase large terminal subunit